MTRSTSHPLSVAPMMDWTDRHYRFFMRGLTKHTLLYTEMVTTGALRHGDRARHLDFSPEEVPLALQLGGDDPQALAECARMAAAWGYSEVNLNVGCPSSRVQSGNFGACLMAQPETVARAVEAMKNAVSVPVTVKHRIGVDDLDRFEDMANFVDTVAAAGADRFSVHARKAWLQGLSPKENRTVPPLRYADVYRLKQEFPQLVIELNGGVTTFEEVQTHLEHVDGVMLGRAAYENPYLFATADRMFYSSSTPSPTRRETVEHILPYIEQKTGEGLYLKHVTRHMLNLFAGQPGARAWRRFLSENAHLPGAGVATVLEALNRVPDEVLDERPETAKLAAV